MPGYVKVVSPYNPRYNSYALLPYIYYIFTCGETYGYFSLTVVILPGAKLCFCENFLVWLVGVTAIVFEKGTRVASTFFDNYLCTADSCPLAACISGYLG
jgi:hypothetical protein